MTVPGILATETPCVHWLDGIGLARVELAITPELVQQWGIDSIPFRNKHVRGTDVMIGRIRKLEASEGTLRAEFAFDSVYGAKEYGGVKRGLFTDASVEADVRRVELVEPETDEQLALYRATEWKPYGGALADIGADPNAKLLREEMTKKQLREALARMLAESSPEPPTTPTKPEPEIDTITLGRDDVVSLLRAVADDDPDEGGEVNELPTALNIAHKQALRDDVPDAVIGNALERCKGDAEIFGLYITRHKASVQQVPDVPPTERVTGGEERSLVAVADTVKLLRAHANSHDADAKEEATKVRSDWRHTTVIGVLEELGRAMGVVRGTIHRKTAILERLGRAEFVRAEHAYDESPGMPGMLFVRSGVAGVVPANLTALFGAVLYQTLMPPYERARINMEAIARRHDVPDYRNQEIVYYDIAGQFKALKTGERLSPLTMRDDKAMFAADPYGYTLTLDHRAIIDDNLGAAGRLAGEMGDWCGSQESRVFQEALQNGPFYTGQYDLAVANLTDFGTHFSTVRNHALDTSPIAAGAKEDPNNDPGRSYAMQPDVMVVSKEITEPLEVYSADLRGAGAVAGSREEVVRTRYQQTLANNAHEGLYLKDEYYLGPGPESTFCPVVYGQVIGEGMSLTVHQTTPYEQKGLILRASDTFGAKVVRKGLYRIRRNTQPAAISQ